ncbi:MAG: transcription termination/antitermination protein NusG [Candidatus Auribacterota bacterium]|nr:transcription termination/antitermination protein NusG [Candidatus Auribacterota bacterium]
MDQIEQIDPVAPADHPEETDPVAPTDHPEEIDQVAPADHPEETDPVAPTDHPEETDQVVQDDQLGQQWYVIHTLSGQEQKVKDALERRAALVNLEDNVTQVLIPYEKVSEVKAGKKIITQRKFWPGYVFIKMEYVEEAYYLINEVPGVIGFVGRTMPPQPVSDKEITAVLSQIEEKKEKIKPKVLFSIGEAVKVTDGPFSNMAGVVENVDPDKGKMTVRVSIFGRETPVELEYWQVEKN